MSGYTKLFGSILDSTIWREDSDTRCVWVTMLAMANQHGEIQASIPGLADRARVSIDAAEAALEKFQSPDRYSRTQDDDGRRVEQIDGGWILLNYEKYREKQSAADKRAKTAERVRRHRARKKDAESCNGVTGVTDVTSNGSNYKQKQKQKQKQTQREEEEKTHTATNAGRLMDGGASANDPQASANDDASANGQANLPGMAETQTPDAPKQPSRRGKPAYTAAFTLFWQAALNKRAKSDAAKAYTAAIGLIVTEDRPDVFDAEDAPAVRRRKADAWLLQRWNDYQAAEWPPPRYAIEPNKKPYPATWLNGRRYDDEITPWSTPSNGRNTAYDNSGATPGALGEM